MAMAIERAGWRSGGAARAVAVMALLVGGLLAAACATNPATGRPQVSLVGEQREIAMGRDAAQEVDQSLGLYPGDALQAYVARVGAKLVAVTERPSLPWAFHVVDDPAVNAFALPGGFVYLTRGLLTYLTSEAELAGVLGHEIGHVTARHSVQQQSKSELAQIGLLAGMIFRPELASLSGLAQGGLGLLFLRYSRNDESQADDLGLRYMSRAGYDPREMPKVFQMLDRVERQQTAASRVPNWLATHPAPADRVRRIAAAVGEVGGDLATRTVEREAYLRAIDHLVFGDDPRQGYFQGSLFVQPDLGVQLRFPTGWTTANERSSVSGTAPDQSAAITLTLSTEASAAAAAGQFFGRSGIQQGARVEIGGSLPAIAAGFAAATDRTALRGVAAFVESKGKVYRLLGFATTARWEDHGAEVTGALATFSRVTDRRALEVEPKRVEVVRLPSTMTLEQFASQLPSTVDFATLSVINQVAGGALIAGGTAVKRVVGPEPPS